MSPPAGGSNPKAAFKASGVIAPPPVLGTGGVGVDCMLDEEGGAGVGAGVGGCTGVETTGCFGVAGAIVGRDWTGVDVVAVTLRAPGATTKKNFFFKKNNSITSKNNNT